MLTTIINLLNCNIFNTFFDLHNYNIESFSGFYKVYKEQLNDVNFKMEIMRRTRNPWHLRADRQSYVMSLLTLSQGSIRYAGLDDLYFYYLAESTLIYLDVLYHDPLPVKSLIDIFFMNYHTHTHDLLLLKSDYELYCIYNDRPFINWAIPLEFHTSGIKWYCNYCQFNYQNQFRETFEQYGGMNQGRVYRHIFHDTRTLRVFFYQIMRDKTETFYHV